MTGRSREMKLKTLTLSIKVPPVAGSWTTCTWEQHIQHGSEWVTAAALTHSPWECPRDSATTSSHPTRGVRRCSTPYS